MAKRKAAPSGIRVSGADSSRVSHGRSSLHGQDGRTAGTRRPSSEADSFGRGLVLWQRGPFGTGSQRARTGRRPGTSRLRIRQRGLLLCWRLRTLSLVPLRMLPSALDSDALELRPVVDVLLCLREWGTLIQHTRRVRAWAWAAEQERTISTISPSSGFGCDMSNRIDDSTVDTLREGFHAPCDRGIGLSAVHKGD